MDRWASGSIVAKSALAVLSVLIAIYLAICISRDKWPTFIGIHNQVEDAACELSVDGDWTWKVSLKAGEQKRWLFPFGEPSQVVGVCKTPTRQVAVAHGFCSTVNSSADQTILIDGMQGVTPPAANTFAPTRVLCAIA